MLKELFGMRYNRKAKILFVAPIPPPFGGIASWTNFVIEWTKNNNREIDIVNTSKSTDSNVSPSDKVNILSQIQRTMNILFDLYKKINQEKFDILHLNSSGSFPGIFRDYVVIRLAAKYKLKIIIHMHYDVKRINTKDKKAFNLLKKILNFVDETWVLNKSSEIFISNITKKTNVRIMPNFISAEIINLTPTYSSSLDNIGYLGTISRSKGIIEIIETAKYMRNINFHLIGPISEKELLNNLPSNVLVYGAMNNQDALDILKTMDVFLFPSYSEGFSISILEAMSQGLPIVTTPVGANKELLNDEGGFIVEVGKTNQIIENLKKLEDKVLRKKMGDRNISKVKKEYNADVAIPKMFEVYDEMIN